MPRSASAPRPRRRWPAIRAEAAAASRIRPARPCWPGAPQRLPPLETEGVYSVANRTSIERSEARLGVDGVVHEPTAYYEQCHSGRLAQIPGGAGEGYTNRAVESGLEFFARLQFPDGHWSLHDLPPGVKGPDAAWRNAGRHRRHGPGAAGHIWAPATPTWTTSIAAWSIAASAGWLPIRSPTASCFPAARNTPGCIAKALRPWPFAKPTA